MLHLRRLLPFTALLGLAALAAAPARALTESQQDQAIANLQATVASQQTTINALVAKLQYVTASGHDLTLTGNLHVVSGAGTTDAAPNGLGNVIIGYNENRTGSSDVNTRTGSHNLVLGQLNNYSGYGGIVAGQGSTVSGAFNSALGGRNNTVSGREAVVSGGYRNTASGSYAVVGGGQSNTAGTAYAFAPFDAAFAGLQTSVTAATRITSLFSLTNGVGTNTELTLSGVNLHIVNGLGATNGEPGDPTDTSGSVVNGLGNLILGYNATRGNDGSGDSLDARTGSHNLILGDQNNYDSYGGIVGGFENHAESPYASVVGGQNNTAYGLYSTIAGGYINYTSGENACISGGFSNDATGYNASVSGGYSNQASGSNSSISGGSNNQATGGISSISGGSYNVASGSYAWIGGGAQNKATNTQSSVSGGYSNTASGINSSAAGGNLNAASAESSTVSGGYGNAASANYSTISGGVVNKAKGVQSSVSGGYNNTVNDYATSVSGGSNLNLSGNYAWAGGSLHSP